MTDQILVELQDYLGSDKSIADAAWTSSTEFIDKQAKTDADVSRIVNMLADAKHSVPFESVVFRFWIRLPIALDRQHMTHRIASHSGMSGRYRTMPSDYLHVPTDVDNIAKKAGYITYSDDYNTLCTNSNEWYTLSMYNLKKNRDDGVITNDEYKRIREFSRGVLPQHNMTERVTVINLRSFANYYKLRSKSDAQPEIQTIATKMFNAILENNVCPIAMDSLSRNGWII